jgi:hypothetical protein
MAQRIGFYSLRKAAREICRLITKFTPVIQAAYPDSETLLLALAAANAACAALVESIDEVAPQGV